MQTQSYSQQGKTRSYPSLCNNKDHYNLSTDHYTTQESTPEENAGFPFLGGNAESIRLINAQNNIKIQITFAGNTGISL